MTKRKRSLKLAPEVEMRETMLDAAELENEITAVLKKEKDLVLATCSKGRVTARTVSHVNIGLDILFQTDKGFQKVEQIKENPKVAICVGNLQVEGTAELSGHPSQPWNQEFYNLYREKHPKSLERYGELEDEVVVRIKPALFTFWKYIEGKPCRDYLDVERNVAYRVFYQNC